MGNEWQEKYREMMEREYFSKEEKENMVRKLMQAGTGREEAAGSRHVTGKNFMAGRFRIKGAAAACLAGCLLLTGVAGASAAGFLKPVSDVFAKVFRLDADDERLAGEIGKPLGESVVSNGIRVSADAVIADSYAYAVVFSVEREDGRPLGDGQKLASDKWDFESADIEAAAQKEDSAIWGESYSYDEVPEDSAIQYVMLANSDGKIKAGGIISVHLSNLRHFDTESSKDYIVEGNWDMELSFPEPSDELVVKKEAEIVELDGSRFTIEDIGISPISYHLTFSIGEDSGLSVADGAKLLDRCTMELELKNGKRIGLGEGGSAVKVNGRRFQFVYGDTFESLVHLEDIKAVRIGEMEIPVQKK
ncbi:DUF4179 domain-containing protein [bacterium D16-51]|nr:DUF4179 domain-containing protein [bacterium D16-59]RKI55611.1 DUF4179 domain-containing protein [bacterium D16-51]